jgi:general stress protein 26
VRDRGKIEQLWKPSLKAWFPQGTSEPDLALLKVDVERAEYWDAPSSPVARAIAVVKGAPAQAGEHRRLELG